MNINLWVDDLRNPDSFGKDGSWHWSKTITDAIRILATHEVTEVSLDHDIFHAGDNPYSAFCCPETFEAVAWYIQAMTVDERPKKVSIHTANDWGRKIMTNILKGSIDEIEQVHL